MRSSKIVAESYFFELYKITLGEKSYLEAFSVVLENLKFTKASFSFYRHIKATAKLLIFK